jgi:hypothetical protein
LKGSLEGVCAGAQADEVEEVSCGIALSVKTFTGGNEMGFAISLEWNRCRRSSNCEGKGRGVLEGGCPRFDVPLQG